MYENSSDFKCYFLLLMHDICMFFKFFNLILTNNNVTCAVFLLNISFCQYNNILYKTYSYGYIVEIIYNIEYLLCPKTNVFYTY